jgi:hypothetical protein
LQDYGNHVWSQDEGVYMILEHWCDYNEEQLLANDGFMLWANTAHEYAEASMGFSSNLSYANFQDHGYNAPHAVSYMETHDEEKLMYNNLNWGNSAVGYDIEELEIALKRIELTACFHVLLPGPKLMWQFQELGYDYSINTCTDGVTVSESCRIDAKPVRWDYYDNPLRHRLYDVFSALNHLKKDYPVFSSSNFGFDTDGFGKRLHLSSAAMNVVGVGNFHVGDINMAVDFQHEGVWFDYLTGEEISVSNTGASIAFDPGEYHIYIDADLPTPEIYNPSSVFEIDPGQASDFNPLLSYPNPFSNSFEIAIPAAIKGAYSYMIFDALGKTIASGTNTTKTLAFDSESWSPGIYHIALISDVNSHNTLFSTTIQKQ